MRLPAAAIRLKKPMMGCGGLARVVVGRSIVGDGKGEKEAREASRRARMEEAK
jgi:orotidine-5'-phosphate decarboxylase